VLKIAMTLDGKVAAKDGSSRWITSSVSLEDVHRLRSEVDAVLVGAGTVRADDPELTARRPDGSLYPRQPARIVLGAIPGDAKVSPARSYVGPVGELLDQLGASGALAIVVEGGPTVAGQLHEEGLIDEYRFYLAPALMGSSPYEALRGTSTETLGQLWRGSFQEVRRSGEDLVVTLYSQRAIDLISNHLDLTKTLLLGGSQ
jgi:diaminohydroxyphosphoribosylaminopyrimidine deaminase/5-amino-6-(5-phosphoribosylamino)uracil reductase